MRFLVGVEALGESQHVSPWYDDHAHLPSNLRVVVRMQTQSIQLLSSPQQALWHALETQRPCILAQKAGSQYRPTFHIHG